MEIAKFLQLHCVPFQASDHHHTGPLHVQRPHGTGGPIFPDEGPILAAFAARWGGPVLEIGGSIGVSTRYIHQGLASRVDSGRVFTVDKKHLWEQDPGWPLRIRIDCDSMDRPALIRILREMGFSGCSWAFIDGDHSYLGVLNDLIFAIACGARTLFFHDTTPNYPPFDYSTGDGADARRVIDDFFFQRDWDVMHLETFCGLTCVMHHDWRD